LGALSNAGADVDLRIPFPAPSFPAALGALSNAGADVDLRMPFTIFISL
jgi:hypothetical protein